MKRTIILLLVIIALVACQKENTPLPSVAKVVKSSAEAVSIKDTLYILATKEIANSYLADSLASRFALDTNTLIKWESGGSQKELVDILRNKSYKQYPDLIMGLSNVFYAELDSLSIFKPIEKIYFSSVRTNNKYDKKRRFMPYEFTFLALVGKTDSKLEYPESWGELQQEKYYSRIVVPDAVDTEIGRAVFLNTMGIFKFHGYASCWKRVRGSIDAIVDSEKHAFDQFWSQKDKLIFLIVNKTNYYPVNEMATKSPGHRLISYPEKYVNDKIYKNIVSDYLEDWLNFWRRYKRS
ncbi:MAG: hypothetical protein B6226_05485 [Candidatus Cloacimonetes bacterium 4572_65]|nr:MAG: hypothetical protein B6226_05485 [Candidatus Cloacimonetes bacterium 4572_65]